MKKNILIVFACALLMSISIPVHGEGVYVSGNVGIAYLSNSDVTMPDVLPGMTMEVRSDAGLACGGALGYDFGNIRIEGEVAYQQNDLDEGKIGVPGLQGEFDVTGDVSSLTFLLNGYYDFTNESPFSFFITGGVGAAKIEINDFNVTELGIFGMPKYSDDDTVFAFQAGAGVGYAINEMVNLYVKYRYLGASDLDLQFDTVKTEVEYSSHNIYAGIRITFVGKK